MENITKITSNKKTNIFKRAWGYVLSAVAAAQLTAMTALASNWDSVTISASGDEDPATLMGNIVGVLLTIVRFAGVGLVVYGVFEIVQSFMQNQPEAKTKGVIMALSGIVMIALKSVLSSLGIIGG